MHPFILSKHKEISDRTYFKLWTTTTMGGRSSLPTPGERSDGNFSGPPSLLWSPWLELGAANQIQTLTQYLLRNISQFFQPQ